MFSTRHFRHIRHSGEVHSDAGSLGDTDSDETIPPPGVAVRIGQRQQPGSTSLHWLRDTRGASAGRIPYLARPAELQPQ